MRQHSYTQESAEHGGSDSATWKAIAELALEDIAESLGKAELQGSLSDEELALLMQHELSMDTLQTIDDNNTAKGLSDASDRRFQRLEGILDQAAQDDRRAAHALLDTGELPPLSEAHRLMDHRLFQELIIPYAVSSFIPSLALSDKLNQSFEDQVQSQSAFNEVFREAIRGPRYMRYNYWGEADVSMKTLADWSETAAPLPGPPEAELRNPVVLRTVKANPSLFKIVTPIEVDIFEELLIDHPNPAFVASVCKGLREGFWPLANTHIGEYPDKYDGSLKMPRDTQKVAFLREQRDIEIEKGRFSQSFGKKLLDGMYSSPIHAVPKRGTTDFRLVTDHSRGKYSLNSMIRYDDISGMPFDNMKHLGEKLLAIHASGRKLMLWKSDVAEAYRLCPMHPHWQIKQVVTIDGYRYIDRNNTFGGRASFKIWGSVNSLVMWIAEHVLEIDRPFCYNDDTYGVCDADDTKFYEPYGRFMPRNQCELLELWDLLGIPHKEKKQLSGNPLTIIGIEVDANEMTMTLPAHAKEALIAELRRFIAEPKGKAPSFSYKEFQQFAGGMNAALNVFPLLRPALTNIFARISETYRTFGESSADKQIQCDSTIRSDLDWALKHIRNSEGIRILQDARAWKPEEADITAYTSSNLKSMVFWYPDLSVAYCFDTPNAPPNEHFLEALCVTSAFLDAASRQRSSAKIVIYTENTGIVKMFDSFHCSPIYNPLFKAVADSMIQHKHRLRVLHISAKKNIVPNLLLRESVSEARKHVSEIASFKPLDKLLGPLKDNLTGEKMHRGTV